MLEVHLHNGDVIESTDSGLKQLRDILKDSNATWLAINLKGGYAILRLSLIDYIEEIYSGDDND